MFSLCAGISLCDCFEWALIDCIVKCRGHSELWKFQLGGFHLPLVSTCFLYVLVFPDIFLLFDCFEWALIDCIEKRRGHSELWQFHTGGPSVFGICILIYTGISLYFLISWLPLVSTCFLCTGISLYLPIIWLFRMGTHWLHWKV